MFCFAFANIGLVVSDTPGGADNIAQYENFWDDAPSHTLSLISKVLSSI